ncbi:hypothetical protein JXO59_13450, partial [candidate division KSB1 bacterium]|nr:hypothetical protein [candidate division KSB1 bacterium]
MMLHGRLSLIGIFLILFSLMCQMVWAQSDEKPIVLNPGPHLFIDDYLIAEQSFLSRTVNHPIKLPEPVVTGGADGDQCFQPYMSVLRDPVTEHFRIWYGTPESASQSHIGYMESEDGIHWIRPHRVLKDPHVIKFGVSVVDRGAAFADPAQRYLFAAYDRGGLKISTSPDGLTWEAMTDTCVLKHNHDITSLHWDPIRQHYLAIVSVWQRREDWKDNQRIPHQSVSSDLIHWQKPWPIITPKIGAPIEQGEMQFYAMSGVIPRGELLIGLVKVLRDDLNATPGKTGVEMGDLDRKAAGLGYTVLAWTRDGVTWQRDHEPFLDRDPVPGTWDHAMAWGDEQIIVDDQTFIYYGGYARGHKVARFDERQIGLSRMPRDRYVAREADLNTGTLITRPVVLKGNRLTVNARIVGEMRLRLLDRDGKPLANLNWTELKGDEVDIPVEWSADLNSLAGTPVRLAFQ